VVQARSPFFFCTFFAATFLGLGLALIYAAHVDPSRALESWAKVESTVYLIRGLGWVIAGLCGVVLTVMGVMEYRLSHGWEPQWLSKFLPAVLVEEIRIYTKQDTVILVRTREGNEYEFLLDRDEEQLCKPGDIIHLWYIGKYVANIVVIEKHHIQPNLRGIRKIMSHQSQSIRAWFVMVLAPVVAGFMLGKGLEYLIFREMVNQRGPKYGPKVWVVSTGVAPALLGVALTVGAILIFFASIRAWLNGWTDEFLEEVDSSMFRSKRSLWN
jgi:hypothetical protein